MCPGLSPACVGKACVCTCPPEWPTGAALGVPRSCPLSWPHASDSSEQERGLFGSEFLKIVQVLLQPCPTFSDHTLALAPDLFPHWFWGTAPCPAWQWICLRSSPGRSCPGHRLISERRSHSPRSGGPAGLGRLLPSPDGGGGTEPGAGVGPGIPSFVQQVCVEVCCVPGAVPGLWREQNAKALAFVACTF